MTGDGDSQVLGSRGGVPDLCRGGSPRLPLFKIQERGRLYICSQIRTLPCYSSSGVCPNSSGSNRLHEVLALTRLLN